MRDEEGRGRRDGDLHRPGVCAESGAGLHAASDLRAPCGNAAAASAVFAVRGGWGVLRGGGVPAGLRGAERAGFPSACGACDEPCGLLVRGAALAADRAVFPRQRGARGTAACRRACARLTGEAPRAGVLCPRQLAGAAGDGTGNELAAAAGVRPGGASWRE